MIITAEWLVAFVAVIQVMMAVERRIHSRTIKKEIQFFRNELTRYDVEQKSLRGRVHKLEGWRMQHSTEFRLRVDEFLRRLKTVEDANGN